MRMIGKRFYRLRNVAHVPELRLAVVAATRQEILFIGIEVDVTD